MASESPSESAPTQAPQSPLSTPTRPPEPTPASVATPPTPGASVPSASTPAPTPKPSPASSSPKGSMLFLYGELIWDENEEPNPAPGVIGDRVSRVLDGLAPK